MQKCSYCGANLPENSRFCGKCGNVQDAIATDAATTSSNTPQPQSWEPEGGTLPATWPPSSNDRAQGSAPAWSPNGRAPETPPPAAEDEDERRRGVLPWSLLSGAALEADALLSSGQAYPPGAPVVQGTPQMGSVPSVAGSPTPYTNAPASNLAQGPANAPASNLTQGPANAPSPQTGPQPTHDPLEPPGTQHHHPPHKHHRHHPYPTQHKPHPAARVTKVAGGSVVKTIMIVVTIVVVVAAAGIAAYFLSRPPRPQPLISINSQYQVGNAPAGTHGTMLQISGQQFSSNSAITFLLDGHVAPGNAGTRSDSNGNFRADITITDAWSVGTHTLTARDASNYSTQNSVRVTIVQPGQANTPGPNGAPPDDATFTLNISVQGRNNTVNQPFAGNEEALHITGHPDPAGGTVCLKSDNGQQISSSHVDNNGTPFTETYSLSCKGSYKSGKLSYTETLLADVITFTDGSGVSCTLLSPQLNQQVTGSYTSNGTFTGTWTYGPVPTTGFRCSDGSTFFYSSGHGTWTGTASGLQR